MGYRLDTDPPSSSLVPPDTDKTETYRPSAEEEKTLKLVTKLFKRAKKNRERYDKDWLEYYKMFRGVQWKERKPAYRSTEVLNLIFRHIQSIIPNMTDVKPRVEFLPKKPEDQELANIFNDVMSSDWDKKNWGQVLTESLFDSHVFGTTFSELIYDPDEDYGLGGVAWQTEDPFHCFPDPSPNAVGINKKSKFYITAVPTDLDEIKEKYPDKGKFVKSDIHDFVDIKSSNLNEYRYKSPTDNTIIDGPMPYDLDSRQALVVTLFLKSQEMVPNEMTRPESPPDEEPVVQGLPESMDKETEPSNVQGRQSPEDKAFSPEMKLKYPKGRKIITANRVVLFDGENPYDDAKIPKLSMQNYILPRQILGESEVQQLIGPQRLYNKIVSYIVDVLTLMGNPIWVVDSNSQVDTDNIVNRAGLVIEKAPGTEVARVPGVELQPYVLNLLKIVKDLFDDISGSTDASRGVQNPGDADAMGAIAQLQEATQTRVRQKSRTLDAFLQEFAQMYMSRILQFYTVPRIVRLTNSKDNVTKYFKFHVEQPGESGPPIVHYRPYSQGEDAQWYLGDEKQWPLEDGFDVTASTGSSLPFTKAEKETKTFKLYDRGIIDPEEVLKNLDYPNYQAVLERMQQNAQTAAQAQAAQPPQSDPRKVNQKPMPVLARM